MLLDTGHRNLHQLDLLKLENQIRVPGPLPIEGGRML